MPSGEITGDQLATPLWREQSYPRFLLDEEQEAWVALVYHFLTGLVVSFFRWQKE